MQLNRLAKNMIRTICIFALVLMVISALYYRSLSCLPFIWGVLLGSAVSVAKVFLLERAVDRALGMEKNRASGYIFLQHLLRLSLTGAALMLSALLPAISLWGTVGGIAAYQASAYLLKFAFK